MLTIDEGLPLLDPEAMRAAEAMAIAAGTPALLLMERAAAAAALAIRRHAPDRPVLVLCGPGNNGGDGYGVAVALQSAGTMVRVAARAPPNGEPAATMAARWTGPVEDLATVTPAPVIVDALYGTGLRRPLPEDVQAAIDRLRGAAVLALDIASGVDALTGAALGRPLAADLTIALGALKRGVALAPALSGQVAVADIGLGPIASDVHLVPAPRRVAIPADSHKYRRGSVLIIEGNPRRGGAAQLTALAALRAGAGVVTLAGAGDAIPAFAIMRRTDDEARAMLTDPRLDAVAIGPGLQDDQRSRDWVARVLAGRTPVVADAGALALLAPLAAAAHAPLVLTPHDGEYARLFGATGNDRIGAARAAAEAAGAIIVLKGAATIVAAPDGQVAVNTHATPWLATAGSGDVLTGIIAALIAQGMALFDAARAGVWLHGDAGLRGGPGLIADDLPALLPATLAAL